jgi:hypothetical protein
MFTLNASKWTAPMRGLDPNRISSANLGSGHVPGKSSGLIQCEDVCCQLGEGSQDLDKIIEYEQIEVSSPEILASEEDGKE